MTIEVACNIARGAVSSIQRDIARDECRFLWRPSTYGRVFSLAALSHETAALDEIVSAAEKGTGPAVMALLVRHLWETWVTGMYLLLGGAKAFDRFAGAQRKADESFQNELDDLKERGLLGGWDAEPLTGFEEYKKCGWDYQSVMREVGTLGVKAGVFATAGEELYTTIYRTLSGHIGAHPTARLLDKYIDTETFNFSIVKSRPQLVPFDVDAVRLAVALSCVHAGAFLDQVGANGVGEYATIIGKVLPSLS